MGGIKRTKNRTNNLWIGVVVEFLLLDKYLAVPFNSKEQNMKEKFLKLKEDCDWAFGYKPTLKGFKDNWWLIEIEHFYYIDRECLIIIEEFIKSVNGDQSNAFPSMKRVIN